MLPVAQRLHSGLNNVVRRREIRLAGTEADDVFTARLHFLRQGADGKRHRRLNGVNAVR